MNELQVMDFIYLGGAAALVILGIVRGLTRELGHVLRLLTALGVAAYVQPHGARFLVETTRLPDAASTRWIAFGAAWLAAVIALRLLSMLLATVIQINFQPVPNRVGGALAGVFKALFAAGALVVFLHYNDQGYLRTQCIQQSRVGAVLASYAVPAYEGIARALPGLGLPVPEPTADNTPPDVFQALPPLEGGQTY